MTPEAVVLHCSASRWGSAAEIERWHRGRGFVAIGYHYVVLNGYVHSGDRTREDRDDGRIEVGRPETQQGAHAHGYNDRSIGVCLIGRGPDDFSIAQLISARLLCVQLMVRYGLDEHQVIGHEETKVAQGMDLLGPPCPNLFMDAFRRSVRLISEEAWLCS